MIKSFKNNNKETGLVVLWVKLRKAEYTRTVQGLYHLLQRLGIYEKVPSKKKENEPSNWVTGMYPGEKVQVDVKYVPKVCISPELQEMGEKYYQYTAIYEYTRIRYTWFTNAHDIYASSEFVKRLVRFYYKRVFCSLEDLRNRGADWRKEYNNFPMKPLGWLSPNEFLKKYKSQGESVVTI